MVPLPEIEFLSAKAAKDAFEFVVESGASKDSFLYLLRWLPEGYELQFYDQYYPNMSDPGAYVSVQQKDGGFIYMLGNHGWSSSWLKQSPELLAAWLEINLKKVSNFSHPLSKITVNKACNNPWKK